jgi:NHLM bacteriocin system ABC transporter peptidase/ATP-binding protein
MENTIRKKRVKTPTLLQMEAVECGAASLAIILAYYGRIVPLEQLRVDCGISRDGSKASNVLKAARTYGLIAKGYRYETEDLMDVTLPVIVFWNFNHFLVVEGFKKNCVYLNDPAVGPRTVSLQDFNESYTGVVLAFEPGPDFQKGGSKKSLYKGLIERLKGSGTGLLYAVLTGLALVLPAMVIPIFTKMFIDNILVNKMNYFIGPLIIGMIMTGIIRAILTWLQQYYLLRMETKLSLSTSSKFFWHILRVPVEFFTQRYAGDISSRVAINDKFAQLLSQQLATNILNFVMILFYLVLLFKYNVLLTVIGIIIASLNILFLQLISRKRKDGNIKLLQERGKLIGTSISGLTMIETLKSSGTESDFYTRWSGYLTKVTNTEQQLNVYTQFLSVIPTFLGALNTLAIIGIGSMSVIEGHMTVGTLVAYQSLMGFFMDPVNKLVNLGSTLQEVDGDMTRIDDVLRYKTDPGISEKVELDTGEDRARKLYGRVELKNITFGYSPLELPLIENFSLTMNPGSRVALVGTSGSGKSTISKLVTGLYQPWTGEILFDGKPVKEIPRKVITNSISMVDQTIMLYEGTIKENISMWDTMMNETNIVEAAKDSSIHDDITAREAGYDSIVEEGGRNFSGGQAQRLEIARALASNPTVMVLDEATSALDPVTEEHIDKSLRRRGCTCIIIAHRLSTIRDCDEIIVMEKGKVVERGTHDQLKDIEGPYNKLIKMY